MNAGLRPASNQPPPVGVTDAMFDAAVKAWDATSNGHARFMVGSNWDECLRVALTAALSHQQPAPSVSEPVMREVRPGVFVQRNDLSVSEPAASGEGLDLADDLERCAELCDVYSPDQVATLIDGIGWIAMRHKLRNAAELIRRLTTTGQGDVESGGHE